MLKSFLAKIVLLTLFSGVAGLAAADVKIGYINSSEIFAQFKGTSDAQDQYDKEVKKWEQRGLDLKKEIEDLQNELEKQSLMLSETKKKEKENLFRQKYMEYQEYVNKVFGPKGEAMSRNEELTKPILKRINEILEKIAREENYDFILDAASGSVIYAGKEYDLTDRVLKILNKE